MTIEFIGYLAAILLALSGAPFAWSAYRSGRVDMDLKGILMILGGMAGMLIYELGTSQSVPQVVDFAFTTFCWAVVLHYKLFPRQATNEDF